MEMDEVMMKTSRKMMLVVGLSTVFVASTAFAAPKAAKVAKAAPVGKGVRSKSGIMIPGAVTTVAVPTGTLWSVQTTFSGATKLNCKIPGEGSMTQLFEIATGPQSIHDYRVSLDLYDAISGGTDTKTIDGQMWTVTDLKPADGSAWSLMRKVYDWNNGFSAKDVPLYVWTIPGDGKRAVLICDPEASSVPAAAPVAAPAPAVAPAADKPAPAKKPAKAADKKPAAK